ncbi:MAG: FecR family protein [Mangrovibacterium sp.]
MVQDKQEFERIAILIFKEISDEISAEESAELKGWRTQSIENSRAYRSIKSSQNFKNWRRSKERVDLSEGWLRISAEIERKGAKKIILTSLSRIAAVFLISLFIGGLTYFHLRTVKLNHEVVQHGEPIKPGSSRATLTLGNGRSVVLDSMNTARFTEIDGTEIQKSQGEINYNKAREKPDTELVYNTIQVPLGGEYRLTLSDGTKVHLNAMSSLRFPVQFGADCREVQLTGEAYFEVEKDTKRPFRVNTREMKVEVLGTSFNLNAYDDTKNTVATLVEGQIKLIDPHNNRPARLLQPNEQAVLNNESGEIEFRQVDVSNYIGWTNGQLVFHNMPLEEIMLQLKRWYAIRVEYADASVRTIRFNGSLDKYEDIEKFIDIIEATRKLEITIDNGTLYCKRAKGEAKKNGLPAN